MVHVNFMKYAHAKYFLCKAKLKKLHDYGTKHFLKPLAPNFASKSELRSMDDKKEKTNIVILLCCICHNTDKSLLAGFNFHYSSAPSPLKVSLSGKLFNFSNVE